MSRKKRELSQDEKHLWRRVASSVKPRRGKILDDEPEARSPDAAKPRAGAYSTAAKTAAAEKPRVGPRLPPQRAPAPAHLADRGAEKRVRRGKHEIDASLDLHGHSQDAAFAALAQFLRGVQRRGGRMALVVTGIGRMGEGVLKKRLPDWLSGPELRPLVSGYAKAHRAHGGAGAFYVFVKRRG